MMTFPLPGSVGSVFVETTQKRGWTPEELAARAADKIISVGDQSHPVVQAQARAFKDNVRQVVLFYLKEAVEQDRATIALRLREAGHPDLVHLLGD
jgi:hypothetical protein